MADDEEMLDIKYKLKKWENGFVKKHNRKPKKDDIEAEQEIKDTYKRYTELKRDKAEKKIEVWGSELNKKPKIDEPDPKKTDCSFKPEKQISSAMKGISEKLRKKTTSFQSLTPRRGIGRSRDDVFGPCRMTPAKENLEPNQVPDSDPSEPFKENCEEETNKIAAMANKFLQNKQTSTSKSFTRRTERNGIACPVDGTKDPAQTDSDAKVLQNGPKFNVLPSSLAISKSGIKSKFSLKSFSNCDTTSSTITASNSSTGTSDVDIVRNTTHSSFDEDVSTEGDPDISKDRRKQSNTSQRESVQETNNCAKDQFSHFDGLEDDMEFTESVTSEVQSQVQGRRGRASARGRGRGGRVLGVGGVKRRAPSGGDENTDAKSCPGDITSPPAKRRVVSKAPDRDSDAESTGSLCEVGWMSEQSELPEGWDVSGNGEVPVDIPSSDGGAMKQVGRKSAKPLSNDNFLRLNMKVKGYRRRGGGMRGEKYKRMQWKQKMKARSESYGNKCFKCGQEGHWANKCKGARKAVAKEPQENTVTEEEFPTMRDALHMARGIKPKPRAKKEKQPTDSGENVNELDGVEDDVELEVVRGIYEAPAPPPSMTSLYERNADGSLPKPTKEVMAAMKKFGYSGFRGGQEEAVMRILCGESTLVVLSTGSGKSLCYQLPAYIYAQHHPCITLVISPLVSLMEDQVTGLPPGLKGVCLHTNMTKGQKEKVIASINEGRVHFLLISPEALVGTGGGGFIPGLSKLPPVAFACIDEVHCVSEWSHHFRPSYLRVCKVLREKLGVKCMLGLTATATMSTAISVAQHLGIQDPESATIRGTTCPDNLMLSVSRDEDRDRSLLQLLQGDRFSGCDSIIVYCTRRQQTERLATLIRTNLQNCDTGGGSAADKALKKGKRGISWDAEAYHAGLSAAKRRSVQNGFMCGKLRIVVATVAFGMGLDKRDVRAIIHYTMPKGFESYVQEIGRAGRDGNPAHCHVFLDEDGSDMNELKKHVFSNTCDRVVLKKLVRRLFPKCRCREIHDKTRQNAEEEEPLEEPPNVRVCPGHERALSIDSTVMTLDVREEVLSTLLCYLELHQSHWIENLPSTYSTCTLQCYGGPVQFQQVAKKCPPVAVAIAQEKRVGVEHAHCSKITFPVIEIADSMGWESGPVKKELKMLQWDLNEESGRAQKSGVLVEIEDLSFHFRSPGDLTDDELEDITNFLSERMTTQEASELHQLHFFYNTLSNVAHKNYWMCSDQLDLDRCERLRSNIRKYFVHTQSVDTTEVTPLTFRAEHSNMKGVGPSQLSNAEESQLRADIRGFINQYSQEHILSGRAIARIFHGIGSPCFPPEVWGRVRRFWRSHLHTDFNLVRKLATQALIGAR